jgi:hypothetical protein
MINVELVNVNRVLSNHVKIIKQPCLDYYKIASLSMCEWHRMLNELIEIFIRCSSEVFMCIDVSVYIIH